MQKITIWILAVIAVVLAAIYGIEVYQSSVAPKGYYPDKSGWNRKALAQDDMSGYLPLIIGDGIEGHDSFHLLSPNEKGLVDTEADVAASTTFVEYRQNAVVNITNSTSSAVTALKAVRGLYALNDGKGRAPIFRLLAEKFTSDDYTKYKDVIIDSLARIQDIDLQNGKYKDHEYHFFLRKDVSLEGLKGKESIGIAYVFFPETNTVESIALFNTRYQADGSTYDAGLDYMISKQEIAGTIGQIIDSATKK